MTPANSAIGPAKREIATWRMIGLGNNDTSVHHSDIDYAFLVAGNGGVLQVYESGNLRGTFGTYLASDRLKVAIEGGVVKYYRNSTLIYTSTVAPAYPLQVDTSLNTVNSGVYNVVIASARLTPSPINYVLQDVQGSTRAVMSGSTIVARHDFLPFGEEISSGTGLRTMGQGFGAEDKIRQRYGMTERDDATGLDHTWWRKYENRAGRLTSADPYLGSMRITNPQSFNRYAYVNNDPVNFVDPSGLDACYPDPATGQTVCIPDINGGTVTVNGSEDTSFPAASDYPSVYGFQPMVLVFPLPSETESIAPQRPPDLHGALSQCLIDLLSKFFDRDLLESIRIHRDSSIVPPTMLGMTLGDNIHFKKGQYDPSTLRGVTLLAHEISHSVQYRIVGAETFLKTYSASSALVLSTPLGVAASAIAITKGINLPHDMNAYEKSASAKAREVSIYLAKLGYGGKGMACLE